VTTPLEVLQEVETKNQGMVFIAAPSDVGLILSNLLTLTYHSTRPDDVDWVVVRTYDGQGGDCLAGKSI